MLTISTRQLKQNPAAVIDEVLASGEPAAITSYGKPTGAVIAPAEGRKPRTWVSGKALMEMPPLPDDVMRSWQRDLAESRQYEFGRDLWGDDE